MKRLIAVLALALVASACGDDSSQPIFETPAATAAGGSSTSAAPSTTLPPPPAFEFRGDGLGVVIFGQDDDVVATLTEMFGPPLRDTGWVDEPICPGPLNRFVDFGDALFDFQVMFTTGDLFAPAGTEHFYSYRYNGATPVPLAHRS